MTFEFVISVFGLPILVANNFSNCGKHAAMASKETTAKFRLRNIQLAENKRFIITNAGNVIPAKGKNQILSGLM